MVLVISCPRLNLTYSLVHFVINYCFIYIN